MIRPVLQDDEFLENVEEAAGDVQDVRLWWLGQSGFLVQWQGRHLLLDPYLSDSLTYKYAATDKPHIRMTEIVVSPERLNFIDLVTSSHGHTDHLDKETLVPLFRANPELQIICPEAIRETVADRVGLMAEAPRTMNAGESLTTKGFRFHAVPAAHNEFETDAWGRHKCLGYIIEAGPWRIYHSGDTKWHKEIVPMVQRWQVHVALLPINGDLPERRVSGNLNGEEAAAFAKEIGADLVVPCHYEMFSFNTATPDAFVAECKRIGQSYRVLRCGERWTTAELAPST